jgi:hypothetical protein
MDLEALVDLAKAHTALGWAVQEQLEQALAYDYDGLNPNAVKLIVGWLKKAERAGVEEAGDLALELEEEFDL